MENFINVPVPAHLVTEVYALIARLSKVDRDTDLVEGGEFEEWSTDHLRQLRDCPMASVQRVALVLDELAKAPDKPIALSELAATIGLQRPELSGAFSGFTRWVNKTWPGDGAWPFAYSWGPAKAEGLTTETYYAADASTAEKWIELRK